MDVIKLTLKSKRKVNGVEGFLYRFDSDYDRHYLNLIKIHTLIFMYIHKESNIARY